MIAGDASWSWKVPRPASTKRASVPGFRLSSTLAFAPWRTLLVKMLFLISVPVKSAFELVVRLVLLPASVLLSTRLPTAA